MASGAVTNQPPPLEDYDLFGSDPILGSLLDAYDGAAHSTALAEFGKSAGSAENYRRGFLAERYPPQLRTHDRFGNRIDEVEFHPAWHELMEASVSRGMHSISWTDPKGVLARTAFNYLDSQVEAGHWCPISMTASAVAALRIEGAVAAEWESRLLSTSYDPTPRPVWEKGGALMGMGMTEKQGGSDVRANITTAVPVEGGDRYLIDGHKWFTSAPMCDAFLVLAQAPGGLTCFLVPRWNDEGSRNGIHIQRLKEKLGNRSNASAEIELDGAQGRRVGPEGRGVPTIIEMVNGTRLDCVSGSAGLMRQAVSQAIHHTVHRFAFGSPLIEKPLMRNVLADLEIEVEAATTLMMVVASVLDHPDRAELGRILTPLAKFWVTKRTTEVVREALECVGGNGYVEESILPRLFRESPLNAIWEGSGNVIALDLLRAVSRQPALVESLLAEVGPELEAVPELAGRARQVVDRFRSPKDPEHEARSLLASLATTVSGALLFRHARPEVAEAFLLARVTEPKAGVYGTLSHGVDTGAILGPVVAGLS